MGTGGSEIYWTHTPDRKAAFASLISDMLGRKQKENDDQVESIAGVLKALPRERWADYVSNLPADVRANFEKKYGGVANVPLSYGEENKVKTDQLNAHDLQSVENSQNGGGPYTPDSISVGRLNPDLAGKAPWMGAAGQRNTYTDAASPTPQLPAAVNTAQQTADNVIPTGQENWTNTNITAPQSKAVIAHTNAETAHANAQTGLTGAQTVHTNAETANVNARTKQISALGFDVTGGGVPDPQVLPPQIKAAVANVMHNPQSFWAEPDKKKQAVIKTVLDAYRIPIPQKLSATDESGLKSNMTGLKIIEDIDALEKKWKSKGISFNGWIQGTMNENPSTAAFASQFRNMTPQDRAEYRKDLAQVREWTGILPIMEAAALSRGRPNAETIKQVKKVAPHLGLGDSEWEGAKSGYTQRLQSSLQDYQRLMWGGAPPTDTTMFDGGGAAATTGGPIVYDNNGNRVK